MTERRSSVRVTIVGEEYTVRSPIDPEHTRAVAGYVDAAIRKIVSSGTVVESHKAAILAAMQIAGELFEERQASAALAGEIDALSGDVRRLLPPAKRRTGAGPLAGDGGAA
jgi:cell division protein ZapA (FtsZ GTPase activity inhibitor)